MNPPASGTPETILVVDDNKDVRKFVAAILRAAHFRVLVAEDAPNAIKVSEQTTERIDLLLSDIDMPAMSGPDLGRRLKDSRPEIQVMLMSGGDDAGLPTLSYGWAYIQKPFTAAKLVKMIAEVLHSGERSQPGGPELGMRPDSPDATC